MAEPDDYHSLFTKQQWLVLFGILSAVLLAAWVGQPPRLKVCFHADRLPCPDLLRAEVRLRYHDSRATLTPFCTDGRSNGCALRRARWNKAVCEVHLLLPASEALLNHEMNHCRGWEHGGDTRAAYAQPWTPNWRLVRSRGVQPLE